MKQKKTEEKFLEGNDIFLNLDEVVIHGNDSYSRNSFSTTSSYFYFKNSTKHGYTEDPGFVGKIKILKTGKEGKNYILKIRFEPEKEE